MRIRNLQIDDVDYEDGFKREIIDSINDLSIIINDNYQNLTNEEIALEFNIGSRLGEPKEYLIVYNNPNGKNNPYVFLLVKENGQDVLTSHTDMHSFESLFDKETRREVNKVISVGFDRLPKHLFLSQSELYEARVMSRQHDGQN